MFTKRLCTVVHGPYPVGEPRVARQVQAALDAGYEVDVVAMRRAGEPAAETVDGARVVRLPLAHRRGAGVLGMLGEYVGFTALATAVVAWLAVRRRYSVVQVSNPPDFLMLAALLPKALGSRAIFDVHDLSPDMLTMRFGERPGVAAAGGVLRAVEQLAARVADRVVTVHEPYRRELIARGVPAGKISVVMNTLDERLLPAGPAAEENGGFRVVYHGTVTPHYGVDLALEAAAEVAGEIHSLRLEVYGEGDAVADLRAHAARLGIGELVDFSSSYLPHVEVLERVRGASAGVIPNLPNPLNRFALSSKLFEYVALGVPVVSADLPTLRAHFSGDEVRFFRAGDAGSLAGALLDVYRHPVAARARAEAAHRRYEEYRWAVNSRRYVEALGP